MENTVPKKPMKVFSCGSVKAAIWLDSKVIDNEMAEIHSIRIDRSYKDKADDEWKHTNTFNAEDLPKVAFVAQEVYKFLRLRQIEPKEQVQP